MVEQKLEFVSLLAHQRRRQKDLIDVEDPDRSGERARSGATTEPRRLNTFSALRRKKYGSFCLVVVGLVMKSISVFPGNQSFPNFQLRTTSWSEGTFRVHAMFADAPTSPSYFDSGKDFLLALPSDDLRPHYNRLNFTSLAHATSFERMISLNDERDYERVRKAELAYMEKRDLRSEEKYDPFDELEFPRDCVRPQWTWKMFPTCSDVHTIAYERSAQHPLQKLDLEYLGHGAFREAVRFTPADDAPPFVVKSKLYKRKLDRKDLHKTNTEALMFERLSASKLTSNIYAHCGSSIVVQSGHVIKDLVIPKVGHNKRGRLPKEVLQVNDVHPMNNLTVSQKVDIALSIAESLAEIHGYEGGTVVNEDLDFGQFLITEDGSIVLNDFNNAIYMEWNLEKQEYCKYYRKFSNLYGSPEEIDGDWMDTSVDIWPMGNIIFGLLTGLLVYSELSDSDEIRDRTREGPPYIDPRYRTRSYAEGRLVEIMERCHKVNATERVDIFEVVQHLRETKRVMSQ